jgi:hypothetical protein
VDGGSALVKHRRKPNKKQQQPFNSIGERRKWENMAPLCMERKGIKNQVC